MNIIIVDNELYQICGCDSNNDLHGELIDYISEQLKIYQIEKNVIRNVIIATINKAVGRVEIANTVCLSFDIFLNEYIIWYLYDKTQNKQDYASAVITHELFHCKDLSIVNTKININKLDKQSTNLTELYINLGFHQWGEYYAHYNSSIIYPSDIITLSFDDKLSDRLDSFNKKDLFDDTTRSFTIYQYTVYPFICKIIILLANSNSIKSEAHILELNKYKSISPRIENYILNVNNNLTRYLSTYPNCLSTNNFLELGKLLIDI